MIARRSFAVGLVLAGCGERTQERRGAMRLTYEQSCARLRQLELIDPGPAPPMPNRMPRYDDEELGVSFFRWVQEDTDLSNLTLPRTYISSSSFERVSFANTDLSESNLCWNDFIDVDFDGADLSRSDLRASNYTRVKFARADLRRCDLRRSSFRDCVLEGARLEGAILTRHQAEELGLSAAQRGAVAWTGDEGEEPEGG